MFEARLASGVISLGLRGEIGETCEGLAAKRDGAQCFRIRSLSPNAHS